MINFSRRLPLLILLMFVLNLTASVYSQSIVPRGLLVRTFYEDYSISPDGRMIAFIAIKDRGYYPNEEYFEGDLYVYDLKNGKSVRITRNWLSIHNLAWSRDSKLLAFTGTQDEKHDRTWIVRPFSRAPLMRSGKSTTSQSIDTYSDCWWTAVDNIVASPEIDNKSNHWVLWDTQKNASFMADHPVWGKSTVLAVDKIRRQIYVLSITDGKDTKIYDIWSGEQHQFQFDHWTRITTFPVRTFDIRRVAFSLSGYRAAIACEDTGLNSRLCILDLKQNKIIKCKYCHPLEWSSNGQYLVSVVQKKKKYSAPFEFKPSDLNGDLYIIRYDGHIMKKLQGAFWARWVGTTHNLIIWRHGKLYVVKGF